MQFLKLLLPTSSTIYYALHFYLCKRDAAKNGWTKMALNRELSFLNRPFPVPLSLFSSLLYLPTDWIRATNLCGWKRRLWQLFLKWGLFFVYLRSFQTKNTINQCEKMSKSPSSTRRWDSNPQPFEHQLSPITTKPGLPPILWQLFTTVSTLGALLMT